MKKPLRMATVFTGAAACAAAFAPTAAAAATAPGTATGTATTTATAGKPLPSNIDEIDCTASDSHWVHLYWPGYADHGPTCLGYAGVKEVDHSFVGFCPGNNYGVFTALTSSGTYFSHFFTPHTGKSLDFTFYVISLEISHWAGSDTCSL
jgi:hypothetical protein